jgi:hypothetical protein
MKQMNERQIHLLHPLHTFFNPLPTQIYLSSETLSTNELFLNIYIFRRSLPSYLRKIVIFSVPLKVSIGEKPIGDSSNIARSSQLECEL